jgi:uncharacterized protein involved in exopolysaccharide biosynthesis
MAATPGEFEPLEHISRIVRYWWVIVVCGVIGGLSGFIAHRLKPPLYEATAVFMASIDFNKIDFMNLPKTNKTPYQFSQYDEDITLVLVQVSLREVEPQVVAFAAQNGLQTDVAGLNNLSTIERKHAYWEVRLRSPDPVLAQKLVNYWAQAGFADLKAKQQANKLPSYLFFDLVQLADLPQRPTYFQTNTFVLAGIVIGLVIGSLAVNLPFVRPRQSR